MASPITDALSSVLGRFDLTASLPFYYEQLSIGLINRSYKIYVGKKATQASYLLQQINTRIFQRPAQLMENIGRVGAYLANTSYPRQVLRPLPTCDGSYFWKTAEGLYWRVFPFIANSQSFRSVDSVDLAYEAAFTFGEYARYLADFDANCLHITIPDFHNTPLRFQHFKSAVKAASSDRLAKAKNVILTLEAWKPLLALYPPLQSHLRVVHYDTKISNVLLDVHSGQGICIVDLDTLMPGMLAYDFGDMVRTFTPAVDENEQVLEKVVARSDMLSATHAGFLDGLKDRISRAERLQLMDGVQLIIFEQAMRFATDYLMGDVYYPVSYEMQNLRRAENQCRLLSDLLEKI
ncbi:MAG: aminoglycoside phosphotransferase family protein [Bacteroidota bacterium]